MPIKFYCKHCGQKLSVTSKKAGKKVACPACQSRITIPVKSETRRTEKPAESAARPKKKKRSDVPPPTEEMSTAESQLLDDLEDLSPLGESLDELLVADWEAVAAEDISPPPEEKQPTQAKPESAPKPKPASKQKPRPQPEPVPEPVAEDTTPEPEPPPEPEPVLESIAKTIAPKPEMAPEPEPDIESVPAEELSSETEEEPESELVAPTETESPAELAAEEDAELDWLEEIDDEESELVPAEDLLEEVVDEASPTPPVPDSEPEPEPVSEPEPELETVPEPGAVQTEKPAPRYVADDEDDDDDDDDDGFAIRSAESEFEDMDLTPMVDVTFLLLIFFMITASFSLQKSIEVPPPNPDEDGVSQSLQTLDDFREESIIVEIDSNNGIYVDDTKLSNPSEIVQAILDRRDENGKPKSELVLSAHKAARHETVVAVVDAANEVGMQKIRLANYKGPDD